MIGELSLPCRYKVFYNSHSNSYQFSTSSGADYEILFIKDNNLFISTNLEAAEIYSLVINKIRKGLGGQDPEIQKTIIAILLDFFKNQNRILTYVYDSNDGKELVRKRMFKIWHQKTYHPDLIKLDNSIPTEDCDYHTGIIFHSENHLGKQKIIKTFELIIGELTNK